MAFFQNSKVLLAGNVNFKLRIVFWNTSFWRFGDLKNESNFLKKKPPLICTFDVDLEVLIDKNFLIE